MRYSITYELDLSPTPVEMEIMFDSQEECNKAYEERQTHKQLKHLKINEYPDLFPEILKIKSDELDKPESM